MIKKCACALLLFGAATSLTSGQSFPFGRKLVSATCPPSCYDCPDDYCPKPLPCPRPNRGGCLCDDYCPKPMPVISCFPRGCVDDYCPKPFPCCLPPSLRPWYTCGSP